MSTEEILKAIPPESIRRLITVFIIVIADLYWEQAKTFCAQV